MAEADAPEIDASRPLVGRDDVMARLDAVATSARSARGAAVLVTGPPGIGKTTVARRFAAGLSDAVILAGRCAPPPAAALRAPSEIAVSALSAGGDLDRVTSTVFGAGVNSLLGEAFEHTEAARRALVIGEGLCRLIDTVRASLVVVLVEDLQWADVESLAVIDYLVDHMRRTLLLVNSRLHESPDADAQMHEWGRRNVAETLTLAPLVAAEVAEMAAALATDRLPDATVASIARMSEGNPLLVEEFVTEAEVAGAATVGLPASYRAAVERRLDHLDRSTREHVVLAAIMGRTIVPRMLETFGVPSTAAAHLASEAARVQLADPASGAAPARFHHALTRDAVADAAGVDERKRLAIAALAEIEPDALDADALEAASHLARAAGDDGRAADLLLEAARRAVRVGATATALRRLDDVADLGDVSALHGVRLRESRVEALALAGRSREAIELGELVLAELDRDGDAPRRDRMRLAIARAAGVLADWGAAADRLDEAFEDYDAAPVDVQAFRAVVSVELGDFDRARELAAAVLGRDDRGGVAECEAHEVLGRAARERSYAEAAEHFRAGVVCAGDAGLSLWRARALLELGLSEATLFGRCETFEEASRSARRAGALGLSAMCDYNLANLYGIHVRPAEAIATAERAIETARRLESPVLEALGWVTLGQAHAGAGAVGKARYAGDRARAAAPDEPEVDGLATGMCDGWGATIVGDLETAADSFARSLAVLEGLPVVTATSPWYYGPVVLAVVDHPATAATRARLSTERFQAVPGVAAASALVDLVVAGRDAGPEAAADREADFERLLGTHHELATRTESVWAILRGVVAVSARRDGWGDPIATLARSEERCRTSGLAVAGWFASLLREAGAPVPRRASPTAVPAALAAYGLTNREYDVLLLVGERLTNREIADRLTVSPSTVKTHVERVLAKTARRGRAELADLVAAVQSEP